MMQKTRRNKSLLHSIFEFLDLLYHSVVRSIRVQTGGATLGILAMVARMVVMMGVFYLMYEVLGLRRAAINGDFLIFLLSGVFLFFMHNGAVQATISGGNTVGSMMAHAPMTTLLTIASSTLSSFYVTFSSALIILFFVLTLRENASIDQPSGLIAPILLAWSSGIVVGLMLLLFKPFAPRLVVILSTVYRRANLISSGKFFVANMIPNATLIYFSWNPLFHCIDQARGAAFVNYFPHNTSLDYPLKFIFWGLVIGMMGEYWLRRTVSRSTGKR